MNVMFQLVALSRSPHQFVADWWQQVLGTTRVHPPAHRLLWAPHAFPLFLLLNFEPITIRCKFQLTMILLNKYTNALAHGRSRVYTLSNLTYISSKTPPDHDSAPRISNPPAFSPHAHASIHARQTV